MRRLLHWVAKLYPLSWRQRYADEFDALLEDIQPTRATLANVFFAALTMQIKTLGVLPILCAILGALAAGSLSTILPDTYVASVDIPASVTRALDTDVDTARLHFLENAREVLSRYRELTPDASRDALGVWLSDPSRSGAPASIRVSFRAHDGAAARHVAENGLKLAWEANAQSPLPATTVLRSSNRAVLTVAGTVLGGFLGMFMHRNRRIRDVSSGVAR